MRDATDDLKDVLAEGSFNAELIVDALDSVGERTLEGLGATEWELRWDRDSTLKSGGSIQIVDSDDDGLSLSPTSTTDPLAPYGQELNLLLNVSAGAFKETVQLGAFRIGVVPSARDEVADFQGRMLVTSSSVSCTLEDRLGGVSRWGFRSEENPASTSAWDEMARISGMQVIRALSDVVLPTTLTYSATRGGRLKAIREIAALLGGTEYTTPEGALSVLSRTPGASVGELHLGESGTIIGDDGGMDSTDVFNVVVGDFETTERVPIHVEIEATGALSPLLIGENTYYHSNPAITDLAAAQAEVAAVLAVKSRPSNRITVRSVVNPLVEDGDVLTVDRRDGSTIVAQLVSHRFGNSMLMTCELDVIA